MLIPHFPLTLTEPVERAPRVPSVPPTRAQGTLQTDPELIQPGIAALTHPITLFEQGMQILWEFRAATAPVTTLLERDCGFLFLFFICCFILFSHLSPPPPPPSAYVADDQG